jgi:hypothetical protein
LRAGGFKCRVDRRASIGTSAASSTIIHTQRELNNEESNTDGNGSKAQSSEGQEGREEVAGEKGEEGRQEKVVSYAPCRQPDLTIKSLSSAVGRARIPRLRMQRSQQSVHQRAKPIGALKS